MVLRIGERTSAPGSGRPGWRRADRPGGVGPEGLKLTDRQLPLVVPRTEKSGSPNEFWMYQLVTLAGWKISDLL